MRNTPKEIAVWSSPSRLTPSPLELPSIPPYETLKHEIARRILHLTTSEADALEVLHNQIEALQTFYRELLLQQGRLIQEGDLVLRPAAYEGRMQLLMAHLYARQGLALMIHPDGHAENIEGPRVIGINHLAYAYKKNHPEVLEGEWIETEQFALMRDPEGRGMWVANIAQHNPTQLIDDSSAWTRWAPPWMQQLVERPSTPLGNPRIALYNRVDGIH